MTVNISYIPQIRFEGFNESWKMSLLNDIANESKVSNKNIHHQNLLSLSYGKIVQKDIESKKGLLPSSFDTYQIIKPDIIVFRVTDLQNDKKSLRVGMSTQEGIITPAYVCIECDNSKVNPNYLFTLLHYYDAVTKVYYKMGDGLRQTLSFKELKELIIYLPNFIEQHQIATYFKSLDSLILSTNQKIESLKQMKSASLLSLFPQAGETKPRVRFKGFEGEWSKYKVSDLYARSMVKNDLSFNSDKIISVAKMYYVTNAKSMDDNYLRTYNVMHLGDIAFEGNKSIHFSHGRFVENTIGDGIVSHVFVVFKPISKKYDLYYWKYFINNENLMKDILIRCTKSSTMMTDLVVEDFLQESFLVPSYEEQKKIGNFFRSLDAQISLETQRLEKLKQIKMACLDKMFV